MSLDAATLALVAGELKNTLLDAKIDKIFEPTRDEVLMTLRTRTETHRLLLSARSGSARVCLTKESFENPLTPPGFCMLLRKHLVGARVAEITQPGLERLVRIELDVTDDFGQPGHRTLVLEAMGRRSNLILLKLRLCTGRCWPSAMAKFTHYQWQFPLEWFDKRYYVLRKGTKYQDF